MQLSVWRFRSYKKAFTLIEVLVVIAIIGILATVVLFNLGEARKQARDAKRIATLEQIAKVLQLYKSEYGSLPNCNVGFVIEPGFRSLPDHSSAGCTQSEKDKLTSFFQRVLTHIPVDPLGPGNNEYYYYFDASHACASAPNSPTSVSTRTLVYANMEIPENADTSACHVMANNGNNQGFYSLNTSFNPDRPTYMHAVFVSCAPTVTDC